MKTYVKLIRGEITDDLLRYHPNAFLLLSVIALRARRTPNMIKNLDVCECQIGDYKSCGLTEQKYRTAKKVLESNGLVTFQPTRKGTVAKITNTDIYDINTCQGNGQGNATATDGQRTGNEQVTTNKNVKKEKNEKKETPPNDGEPVKTHHERMVEKFGDGTVSFVCTFMEYVTKADGALAPKVTNASMEANCDTIDKFIRLDHIPLDKIKMAVRWARQHDFWKKQVKSLSGLRKKKAGEQNKMQKILTQMGPVIESMSEVENGPFNIDGLLSKIKNSPEESRKRNEERVSRLNEFNNNGGYKGDVPY